MARRNNVPKGAMTERVTNGRINQGPNAGERIVVTLYRGQQSQGYKSNYERKPHRWVTLEWLARPKRYGCWQVSGARYTDAIEQFNELAELIDTSGSFTAD